MTFCARAGVGIGLAAVTTMVWQASLAAHPASLTEVAADLSADRHVVVTVTTDAGTLIAKLEALRGGAAAVGLTKEDRATQLVRLADVLVGATDLRFDGDRVVLRLLDVAERPDGQAVIRLAGNRPEESHRMTWRTSLVYGTYAFIVRTPDGRATPVEWLQGPQVSTPQDLARGRFFSALHTWRRSFALGFTHILPRGLDHILFVLGLFLLSARLRPVLVQVSAFTVAHSLTLGLTLYGVVSVPPLVVEPLIALSIAYVAVENIFTSEVKPWRVGLVFAFGLLHGMGFAGALAELNLARSESVETLVTFNLGVEAGQLTILAAAAALVAAFGFAPRAYRRFVVWPASAAIALAGVIWTVERLV